MARLQNKYRPLANAKLLNRFLQPLPPKRLRQLADQHGFDWHARKIFFQPYFRALLLFQLTDDKSLRDWHAAIQNDPLYALQGAHFEVSVDALSHANATRPYAVFVELLTALLPLVEQLPQKRQVARELSRHRLQQIQQLLTTTRILDSTTFSLRQSLCQWAQSTKHAAGFKLHLKLAAGYAGVRQVLITPGKDHDSKHFAPLLDLSEPGQIYLFDCGYRKIKTYERITESGNPFVTTLHAKITVTVEQKQPLPKQPLACGYQVSLDARVAIGEGDRKTAAHYRLIRGTDTQGNPMALLTDLLDLPVEQVCLLHSYRWTVEIVFRWLKHQLHLKHFFSTSANGVVIQLLVALIVYCLYALYRQGEGALSLRQVCREVRFMIHAALYEAGYQAGLEAVERKRHRALTRQTSPPR
jgi:hypothetical protein